MQRSFALRLALSLALLLISLGLCAQVLNVFAEREYSLQIPHSYNEVTKLTNGDLLFLDIQNSSEAFTVSGFKYLLHDHTFTAPEELGSVVEINEKLEILGRIERFGKYYLLCQYPESGGSPTGIVVIKFDAEGMDYRVINEFNLAYFSANYHADIIAEDILAIALQDSLICYNLVDGSHWTVLSSSSYPNANHRQVHAIPDGHFMLVCSDYVNVEPTYGFIVFDDEGTQVCTHSIVDPSFAYYNDVVPSWEVESPWINGRFYLILLGTMFDERILECHFPTPDSLHCYLLPRKIVNGEYSLDSTYQLVRFQDDVLFRRYLCSGHRYEAVEGPYENNPPVLVESTLGSSNAHINSLENGLNVVTTYTDEGIYMEAYCPLSFPDAFAFNFNNPFDFELGCTRMFSHGDRLLYLDQQGLMVFYLEWHVGNDDGIATPAVHTLSAYPNPMKNQLSIKTEAALNGNSVDVYNIRGELVRRLKLTGGETVWDGKDTANKKCANGIYFIKLKVDGNTVSSKKISLIK